MLHKTHSVIMNYIIKKPVKDGENTEPSNGFTLVMDGWMFSYFLSYSSLAKDTGTCQHCSANVQEDELLSKNEG